jgi:hypothetical protein
MLRRGRRADRVAVVAAIRVAAHGAGFDQYSLSPARSDVPAYGCATTAGAGVRGHDHHLARRSPRECH